METTYGESVSTIAEARKILGTTAKGLSDDALKRLIVQIEILTDIVVARARDSIIKSCIDNTVDEAHTDE